MWLRLMMKVRENISISMEKKVTWSIMMSHSTTEDEPLSLRDVWLSEDFILHNQI